jgi:nucleotide-binding universal stress UspA family protein
MSKKILAAIDNSENAMQAVEFIAKALNSDSEVTLLSLLEDTAAVCEMQDPSLSAAFVSGKAYFCALEQEKKETLKKVGKKAKALLIEAGFKEDKVTAKLQVAKKGIARDIIAEAESGGYDAIVLGRRGLSGIKQFMLGSVSQKILSGCKGISIILVE